MQDCNGTEIDVGDLVELKVDERLKATVIDNIMFISVAPWGSSGDSIFGPDCLGMYIGTRYVSSTKHPNVKRKKNKRRDITMRCHAFIFDGNVVIAEPEAILLKRKKNEQYKC